MDIPGLPARRAALKLLDAVLRRGETLDQAAHNAVQGIAADSDRALAKAIAGEALRWLTDIDALIDSATRERLPDDAKARAVLRLMLAQWLRLGTPPHAVIATALPLLTGGPKRLAHGVFAALTRSQAALPPSPSLPAAVSARWGEAAGAIIPALAKPPPLDLTLRDPAGTAEWTARLGGVSLMPGHVRLPRGDAVQMLEGFTEGAWWVQDLAASLPARLLGQPSGRGRALDLCAAPGGKTLQLAAAGWQVTAVDMSAKRLERLTENLARCGLAADVVTADVLDWEPDGTYDAGAGRRLARTGWNAGLCGLLAGAGGRRSADGCGAARAAPGPSRRTADRSGTGCRWLAANRSRHVARSRRARRVFHRSLEKPVTSSVTTAGTRHPGHDPQRHIAQPEISAATPCICAVLSEPQADFTFAAKLLRSFFSLGGISARQ